MLTRPETDAGFKRKQTPAVSLRLRRAARRFHLLTAVAIGLFIYVPALRSGAYGTLTVAILFPVLALTGFGMWQGPRIVRRLRLRRGS
jgi:hypothetical protein